MKSVTLIVYYNILTVVVIALSTITTPIWDESFIKCKCHGHICFIKSLIKTKQMSF